MSNGAGSGGNASGSDNAAPRNDTGAQTPGGETAVSTPVPDGSNRASPGTKQQPDDSKPPSQR
jgi:hypothetical protein